LRRTGKWDGLAMALLWLSRSAVAAGNKVNTSSLYKQLAAQFTPRIGKEKIQ